MGRYSGKTCRLIFMLVLTVAFFVAELVSGYLGNSIALLSDSFNMLSDLISLCVGLSSGYIARRSSRSAQATYGYARAEVGALSNAVFLTALCFTIFVEAILRLAPERIDDPELVLIVGALGAGGSTWVGGRLGRDPPLAPAQSASRLHLLTHFARPSSAHPAPSSQLPAPLFSLSAVFKSLCRLLPSASANRTYTQHKVSSLNAGDTLNTQNEPEETVKTKKKSEALNIRGVLLHVMGDALGSVVVVITAIIFYVRPLKTEDPCNWQCYIDPSLTVIMVIIILSSAFPLIKETASILLQMVPKGVNVEELMSKLSSVHGVSSVHELHIWELISGKIIATLHIKYQKGKGYEDANVKIREIFHNAGIHSVTIQFENVDLEETLQQKDLLLPCSSPCISKSCARQLCCPPEALPLGHVNGCVEHNGYPTLDVYGSDGLSKRNMAEVAIDVPSEGYLSVYGQAHKPTQEEEHYVNCTHF
uniref:Solute carrier family 30 member 10 n=1 Tax=Loxodonta africana TaxID=9785 RepID=G3STD3_LOXAF